MRDLLREIVARRADAPPSSPPPSSPPGAGGRDAFLRAFSGAARRFRGAFASSPEEEARLRAAGVDWPLAPRLCDVARIAMLLDAAGEPDFATLAADCFRAGDNDERRAVLRALPLLPAPERFVALAVEACRTNVVPVFEAIACENPYPSRHFPDASFNQMVVKALFVGVALARVLGLGVRVSPELSRMARDFASERRSAGRPVPPDVDLLAPGGNA